MTSGNFTTFIIPSIGRQTLHRFINSLHKLNDIKWEAIICFDGVEKITFSDPRIRYIESEKKNSPGLIRNLAFPLITTPWISFLDDDDIIYPNYIEELKAIDSSNPDLGFVLFRMITDRITPAMHIKNKILINEAGISFSVKTDVVNKHNARFNPKGSEDYEFLKYLEAREKFVISDNVVYEVCRNNADKELK